MHGEFSTILLILERGTSLKGDGLLTTRSMCGGEKRGNTRARLTLPSRTRQVPRVHDVRGEWSAEIGYSPSQMQPPFLVLFCCGKFGFVLFWKRSEKSCA